MEFACSQWGGTVEVLALTRAADGLIDSLAFDYSATCEGDAQPTRGSFRWGSTLPYAHTSSPGLLAGDTVVGRTVHRPVVLTNSGTRAQTYGRSEFLPADRAPQDQAVVVEADGCAGVTLAPGGICSVDVALTSEAASGGIDGHLRTPDGTLRGSMYSQLSLNPVPAPQPVTLMATPERGAVRLFDAAVLYGYPPPAQQLYRVLRALEGGPEHVVAHDVVMPWWDTAVVLGSRYTYRVVASSGGEESAPSNSVTTGPLPVVIGAAGTFVPVEPVRLVDTRSGTGGRAGKLEPGGVMTVDPGQHVPGSGVSALLLNVTGTEPTSPTFLSVAPTMMGRPTTSTVNLAAGQTRANQVVVPVAADGTVQLYNNHGQTHVVVDLQGFYSEADGVAGGGYYPGIPRRVMDTRASDDEAGAFRPGEAAWISLEGLSLPRSVRAVEINLTVTDPTTAGHLTAWAGDGLAPNASNVNFATGQTIAGHAVVPVAFDENGQPGIALRNSDGFTHVIIDLLGWYDDGSGTDGLRFSGTNPNRALDTRTTGGKVAAGTTRAISSAFVPPARAHVVNVTATEASTSGWARVWSGMERPNTSTVNFVAGEDSPNLATTA